MKQTQDLASKNRQLDYEMGKEFMQAFLKISYRNGQQAYEKMFIITNNYKPKAFSQPLDYI